MTDAIKAGESPSRDVYKTMAKQLVALAITHYLIWPAIRDAIWDKPELTEEGTIVDGQSWMEFITQWIIYIQIMFAFMCVLLYYRQENMVYVPNEPYQYMS